MQGALDLVTADFDYVRWLGNRKGIEEQTTAWDKAVIDRQNDLRGWVVGVVLRRLVEWKISASEKYTHMRLIITPDTGQQL